MKPSTLSTILSAGVRVRAGPSFCVRRHKEGRKDERLSKISMIKAILTVSFNTENHGVHES